MDKRKSSLDSKLYEHAERELKLAGLFGKDSDYEGMLGDAALELIDIFASQRHSGASANLTIRLFKKLAQYENLTPLTSDPTEWGDVSATMGRPMWQNRRNPSYFSDDGGKTSYTVKDMGKYRLWKKILKFFGIANAKPSGAK